MWHQADFPDNAYITMGQDLYQMGPMLVDGVAGLLAKVVGHTEFPNTNARSLSQPLLNEAHINLVLTRIPELERRLGKIQNGDYVSR